MKHRNQFDRNLISTQSTGAVDYTEYVSAEEYDSPLQRDSSIWL